MKFDLAFIGSEANRTVSAYLQWVETLTYDQIIILTALTVVLLLFLAYRWFGYGGFGVVVVLVLVLFSLYMADAFDFYFKQTRHQKQHMDEIQHTINQSFHNK